jgi:hypothetical protein
VNDGLVWVQLRSYVDGCEGLEAVLAPLLDVCVELEELSAAGYVLEQPVEADGLRLGRVATAGEPCNSERRIRDSNPCRRRERAVS